MAPVAGEGRVNGSPLCRIWGVHTHYLGSRPSQSGIRCGGQEPPVEEWVCPTGSGRGWLEGTGHLT